MEFTNTYAAETARRVAEAIEDSGVTVVWLCEKTGIPRTTMHRRLNVDPDFRLNELRRIADALRVPMDRLLPNSDRVAS